MNGNQLGLLTIDVNILRLAVAQIVADNCRRTRNPNNALRTFSEKLHKRLDRGPQPDPSIQEMIEVTRQRVDDLINAAGLSLAD
jgi:signal transduction histidine kinase